MYFEGFLDVLVRSALVGVQSLRSNEMLAPEYATKVLFQSLSRQLNKSAVVGILAKRRSTCAYPAGLLKGTMALNSKYLIMWKRDRCVDYLIEASQLKDQQQQEQQQQEEEEHERAQLQQRQSKENKSKK